MDVFGGVGFMIGHGGYLFIGTQTVKHNFNKTKTGENFVFPPTPPNKILMWQVKRGEET
jgi:hypothetical protein